MRQILFRFTAAFIGLVAISGEAQAQEDSLEVVIPSTEDAPINCIVPPNGFEVSDAFNGYISMPNSSAIILVQINNANYLKIAEGMNEEYCRENNFQFISSTDITSDHGVKGKIFKLGFMLEGDEWIRYMVFAGDLQKTIWMNVTYPRKLEELIEGEILKCVQTINLNPAGNEE